MSDDAELERVGDTDMVDAKARAVGGGRPIRIGWMKGLSRRYQAREAPCAAACCRSPPTMNATSWSRWPCFGDGDPGVAEPAVMAFLNSNPMVLWAKKELGLEFVRRDW